MEPQILDRPENAGLTPAGTPNPNRQRANTALVIGGILIALYVLSIISYYMQAELLGRIAGGNFDMSEATSNDLRVQALVFAEIAVRIVFIVVFIMWFRRAYFNLEQYGTHTRFSEGWAAGAWFVPFLNLVRPFQIMSEIWEEYTKLDQNSEEGRSSTSGSGILWLWWLIYLIGGVVTNVGSRQFDGSVQDMIGGTYAIMMGDVMYLVAILSLMFIIKSVRDRETRLIQATTGSIA